MTRCTDDASLRLVILARSLDYGGAERQLVALARGLHDRGHRVVVAVFYPGGPLEQDLRAAEVPVHAFEKHGRWDTLGFALRLLRFLRRERPSVLHGYLEFPNLLTVMVRPFIGSRAVWGIRASNRELDRYDWLTRLVNRLERTLSRFPDLIIVNSHAGHGHIVRQGFPTDRVIVIPNGIDTDRFRPDAAARTRGRTAFGIGPADHLVGLVGRLDPMKDHPSFLEAAARVRQTLPGSRFLCVGNGPAAYAADLRSHADTLGLGPNLIWADGRDDMPTVYNALDIAVSASANGEGFPNVVGEAMACGVPCVVTDVGDSARIVGEHGVVVPPRNPAALATAIEHLLERRARGEINQDHPRTRIVTCFANQRLIERTEEALLSLTRKHTG